MLSEVEITNVPVTYTLYIWIDGNMDNPNTMYNQNFEFRLSANATDHKLIVSSDDTLKKLGLTVNEGIPDFSKIATTDEGVWKAQDDYGTSYYFRGAVENNYVKFANFYWRIIRINGDGSIRLIYDGTEAHANGEISDDRQVKTSKFNRKPGDNAYIGYMYGTPVSSTYGETHGNMNDSTVKTYIDNWYKTNIVDKGYSDYVSDAIYCNDRSMKSGEGYRKKETYYKAYERVMDESNPTLICAQQNDRFTVDDTSKGNGALTYPVGLITVDEASMAGASWSSSNASYYLYTGREYWTMSPSCFDTDFAIEFHVSSGGYFVNYSADYASGVKPVISLKSDVVLSGTGTQSDPWTVQLS